MLCSGFQGGRMIWISHIIFSNLFTISFLKLLGVYLSKDQLYLYLLVSSISSILPDSDTKSMARNTIIGKFFYYIFFFPFVILRKKPRHRGATHTFLFLFLLTILLFFISLPLRTFWIILPFLSGYLSHIILDSFTIMGVQPYIPISKKRVNWKIKTKSLSEFLFMSLVTVFFVILEILSLEVYFSMTFFFLFIALSLF